MENKILYPLPKEYPITFKFAEAPDWYLKQFGYPHNGIDIGCPVGVAVFATDDGEISYADRVPDADGCGIFIKHSWGYSEYWHLNQVCATLGQCVKKGDIIGYSGATGFVSGPHLHFGVKVAGDCPENMRGWSDPEKYLQGIPVVTPVTGSSVATYVVQKGDSLWKIAENVYKKGYLWPTIYKANSEKISNPNLIIPGQVLIIP